MRDSMILTRENIMRRQMGSDVRALAELGMVNRARVDAMETVVTGSRWAFVKFIFWMLVEPEKVSALIQAEHGRQIEALNIAALERKLKGE
ncbi:MAG: hypothetical protein HY548_07150 [Elusimicrobia bacterium]|nr:hypothetical protein [Elusimicrobiota bacterium]